MLGQVLEVSTTPAGDELASPHLTGSVILTLTDVSDFTDSGGTVLIQDTTYDYIAVDREALTLTLSAALTADLDEAEKVYVYPLADEKWAMVEIQDDEDVILARVPHSLYDRMDLGVRDPEDQEAVNVELQGGDWAIIDIIQEIPTVNGSFLDPTTLPGASDTVPPDFSPTPTVTALGYSGVMIRWPAVDNADPVRYKVFFDAVNPPVQQLSDTSGNMLGTNALPDGTALVPGTPYYAQIQAYDEDGDAPLGVVGSGTPILIPADAVSEDILVANQLFSREGYFGEVSVEQLTAGEMTAVVAVVGALTVGAGIKISNEDGISIETPLGTTKFPSDGSDIDLKGNVVAQSLTVLGNLAIRGTNNEVSKNASITLETGVTAPKAAPTITAEYDIRDTSQGYTQRGFAYHSGSNRYIRIESVSTAVISPVFLNSSTGNYDFAFENWDLKNDGGRSEVMSGLGGCAIIGNDIYILCRTNEAWGTTYSGRWYVYVCHYNGSGVPVNQRWSYVRRFRYLTESETTVLSSLSDWDPAIGTDGTNLFIVQASRGGDHYRTSYSPTGTKLLGPTSLKSIDGSTIINSKRHTVGLIQTAADVGSTVWFVVYQDYPWVYSFTLSATNPIRQTAHEFPTNGTPNRGIYWDGNRFIVAQDKQVVHHSQIKDTNLSSSPINAAQTWRLADGTAPDYAAAETSLGPRSQTATFPKRAWLRLRSPVAIPDESSDPSDADSLSFYIARGTGVPLYTSYLRAATPSPGVDTVLLDVLPTAGGNPPAATSGFAAGVPAQLESAESDASNPLVLVRGDGKWRLNAGGNLDDSGWVALVLSNGWQNYGTPFAPAACRKVGNRVYLRGLVRYGSGTLPITTLPAGFRPVGGTLLFVTTVRNRSNDVVDLPAKNTGNPSTGTVHTHPISSYSVTSSIIYPGTRIDVTEAGVVSSPVDPGEWVSLTGIDFFTD